MKGGSIWIAIVSLLSCVVVVIYCLAKKGHSSSSSSSRPTSRTTLKTDDPLIDDWCIRGKLLFATKIIISTTTQSDSYDNAPLEDYNDEENDDETKSFTLYSSSSHRTTCSSSSTTACIYSTSSDKNCLETTTMKCNNAAKHHKRKIVRRRHYNRDNIDFHNIYRYKRKVKKFHNENKLNYEAMKTRGKRANSQNCKREICNNNANKTSNYCYVGIHSNKNFNNISYKEPLYSELALSKGKNAIKRNTQLKNKDDPNNYWETPTCQIIGDGVENFQLYSTAERINKNVSSNVFSGENVPLSASQLNSKISHGNEKNGLANIQIDNYMQPPKTEKLQVYVPVKHKLKGNSKLGNSGTEGSKLKFRSRSRFEGENIDLDSKTHNSEWNLGGNIHNECLFEGHKTNTDSNNENLKNQNNIRKNKYTDNLWYESDKNDSEMKNEINSYDSENGARSQISPLSKPVSNKKNVHLPVNITLAMKHLFNGINPKDISISNKSFVSPDGILKFSIQLKQNILNRKKNNWK